MFLAVLFHALNFPSNSRGYHMQTSPVGAAKLGDVYSKVVSSEDWPASTIAEITTYTFDFVAVDDSERQHTIFRMEYLDYPGEILQPDKLDEEQLEKLSKEISSAQALFGLIDGMRLRQLLRGEPRGRDYLTAELLPTISLLQSASCPVQLVLTKWDAVCDGDGHGSVGDQQRFAQVREALAAIPQIDALVRFRRKRRTRLIPVSSLGPEFVTPPDDDGMSGKRPGGRLRPINIEVPLCAVIPDLLKQVQMSLDESQRSKLRRFMRGRMFRDVRSLVTSLLKSAGGAVLGGHPQAVVFLEWLFGRHDVSWRTMRSLPAPPDLQRLRVRVIQQMETRVSVLEVVWPDSVLSGGDREG